MAPGVTNGKAVEQSRHPFDLRNQFDIGQAEHRNPEFFEKKCAVLTQPSQSANQDSLSQSCSRFF